jgi:hypothetical protein
VRVPLPHFDGELSSKHVTVDIVPTRITVKISSRQQGRYALCRVSNTRAEDDDGGESMSDDKLAWGGATPKEGEGQEAQEGADTVQVGEVLVLNEQLRQKVKASESIWWLAPMPPLEQHADRAIGGDAGVGDGGVGMLLVLQLHKWHQRNAGNCRDASQTWWRTAFLDAGEIEDPEARYPPTEYYGLKDGGDDA